MAEKVIFLQEKDFDLELSDNSSNYDAAQEHELSMDNRIYNRIMGLEDSTFDKEGAPVKPFFTRTEHKNRLERKFELTYAV